MMFSVFLREVNVQIIDFGLKSAESFQILRSRDYEAMLYNVETELVFEALHAKLDALREQEILRLIVLVERLSEKREG